MDAVFAILGIPVWVACFVTAFILELTINRRPFVVAVAMAILAFAVLVLLDWPAISTDPDSGFAAIYASIAALGFLPALAGAGLGRFFRLWIALKQESREAEHRADRS